MSDIRQRIETLSPRQREILCYVAQHLSSKEIGFLLDLSAATVDSHIRGALQRLDLRTRRDAAVIMIEFGAARPHPDSETLRRLARRHHGDDRYTNRSLLARWRGRFTSRSSRSQWGKARGDVDGLAVQAGMARVILRYLLDAIYISLFFAVMSAVAFGVQWIVIKCDQWQIDPTVLIVLKGVSYLLVVLDSVGVVTVTGLLTYRFIRATMKAGDLDA
jgi:DNA-binding CsgD family transcriptional regulator